MKIQLDTTNKTITLSDPVNLGELITLLSKKMFPNGEWKEFEVVFEATPVVINTPPIYIPWNPYQPIGWWEQPYVTCESNGTDMSFVPGIYNIEYTDQ